MADAFASFLDSQSALRNSRTNEPLMNSRQISTIVQSHLKRAYLFLCCAFLALAAGAYLHLLWNIGGLLTNFECIGSMGWLLVTPWIQEVLAPIGGLIDLAIKIDRSILVSAFVGIALAFGCFSAAAMYARRREYLYLGGFLSSGLAILMWLQFASAMFGGSVAVCKFELYIGLLVFAGFIVRNTREIIEKADLGDNDPVKHPLLLFNDFVAVFVRILGIMLKNSFENMRRD